MTSDPRSANLVLSPSTGASTRTARRAVRTLCESAHVRDEVSQAALLLTTELVMNAFEHGGGEAVVDATVDERSLCVSVADHVPTVPRPRHPALDAERGRGLSLVEALATRWGTRGPREGGKAVWFELDLA